MLTPTQTLLERAHAGKYGIGAFNVYNLEGVAAVIQAAEAVHSPVMLQVDSTALEYGGMSFLSYCLQRGDEASVPVAVQLDHSSEPDEVKLALETGVQSVMVDGSGWLLATNAVFSRDMAELAHGYDAAVEAELGALYESDALLSPGVRRQRYTDPQQAAEFVEKSGVDMLAVCIGNVHGGYPTTPDLDFAVLAAIRRQVDIPLVLHGADDLPYDTLRKCAERGIRKLNFNHEHHYAYLFLLQSRSEKASSIVRLMQEVTAAMQSVITKKLDLIGSAGKAN